MPIVPAIEPGYGSNMILYGSYTSPYVRHCRIALAQSGLTHEFLEVAANDPNNPSPTRKIPYFADGSIGLSDSSSILKYVRQKSGAPFLESVEELELYCLASTYLDAEINLFMFERLDGLLPERSAYLRRQRERVTGGLTELDRGSLAQSLPLDDGQIRLACLLSWGVFRNRFSLEGLPGLKAFIALANSWQIFSATAPPQGA